MTDADPREERAQKMIRAQDIELDLIAESGGVTPRRSEIIWCDIARDLLGLIHDLRAERDEYLDLLLDCAMESTLDLGDEKNAALGAILDRNTTVSRPEFRA